MARKKINLDLASVDNREMRLGSIISWDGSASELVKASNYDKRGQKKTEGADVQAVKAQDVSFAN